jgi:CheY-like chemotaxis protein
MFMEAYERVSKAADESTRRAARSRQQTKRPKVLVANDDEGARHRLNAELRVLGFDVMEVNDSAQALEALAWAVDGRSSWPDVLVLDLRTSSFAGFDVLSALAGFADLPPTLLVNALPDQSVKVVVSTFGTKQDRRKLELNAVLAAVLAAACKAASVPVASPTR